ncbi:hypothetical protein K456DRAFT_1922688 [Colletotrichum gloeosporioides 23]|nr:hypothetical protein K456DRAFT_1922688 [Colletotrichum gloeosporioides 23]
MGTIMCALFAPRSVFGSQLQLFSSLAPVPSPFPPLVWVWASRRSTANCYRSRPDCVCKVSKARQPPLSTGRHLVLKKRSRGAFAVKRGGEVGREASDKHQPAFRWPSSVQREPPKRKESGEGQTVRPARPGSFETPTRPARRGGVRWGGWLDFHLTHTPRTTTAQWDTAARFSLLLLLLRWMDATQRAQSICSPTIEEEIAVAIEPQNCCHPLQLAQQEKTNHLVRHQHRHRHQHGRRPWLCRRCLTERPVVDASATPLVRTSDPRSPHLETMYLPPSAGLLPEPAARW